MRHLRSATVGKVVASRHGNIGRRRYTIRTFSSGRRAAPSRFRGSDAVLAESIDREERAMRIWVAWDCETFPLIPAPRAPPAAGASPEQNRSGAQNDAGRARSPQCGVSTGQCRSAERYTKKAPLRGSGAFGSSYTQELKPTRVLHLPCGAARP